MMSKIKQDESRMQWKIDDPDGFALQENRRLAYYAEKKARRTVRSSDSRTVVKSSEQTTGTVQELVDKVEVTSGKCSDTVQKPVDLVEVGAPMGVSAASIVIPKQMTGGEKHGTTSDCSELPGRELPGLLELENELAATQERTCTCSFERSWMPK